MLRYPSSSGEVRPNKTTRRGCRHRHKAITSAPGLVQLSCHVGMLRWGECQVNRGGDFYLSPQ
jgi:hypothetical protein